ncbi:MAG: NnrU family protein [Geminicoccaceae bacterium]
MDGWPEFALAYAVFLAAHAVPARPAVRARLVAWLGRRLYLGLYIAASVVLLIWLIRTAQRAPFVALWAYADWQAWVPNLAMPFVCLLAAFGLAAPNPLSLGGRATGYDPERPGIAGITRHPVVWALTLWALAHLFPNGDLAHVLLFGGFALFSLAGMAAIDRRQRQRFGEAAWQQLARHTSFLPFAAMPPSGWPTGLAAQAEVRVPLALAAWLALLGLHPAIAQVSPLPPGW